MNLTFQKSDRVGIIASSICLVHCMATPLFFVAKTCTSSCCAGAPDWWRWIDILFLAIAFVAVLFSAKATTNKLVSVGLWVCWSLLAITVANESLNFIKLFDNAVIIPTTGLIVLHFYNRKYCKCTQDSCCAN